MNKVLPLGDRSTRRTTNMCHKISVSCDPTLVFTVSFFVALKVGLLPYNDRDGHVS